jgi:hypothetical protein
MFTIPLWRQCFTLVSSNPQVFSDLRNPTLLITYRPCHHLGQESSLYCTGAGLARSLRPANPCHTLWSSFVTKILRLGACLPSGRFVTALLFTNTFRAGVFSGTLFHAQVIPTIASMLSLKHFFMITWQSRMDMKCLTTNQIHKFIK